MLNHQTGKPQGDLREENYENHADNNNDNPWCLCPINVNYGYIFRYNRLQIKQIIAEGGCYVPYHDTDDQNDREPDGVET